GAEEAERLLLLVEHRDVPPFAVELERDRGTHPAGADDQHFHALTVAQNGGLKNANRVDRSFQTHAPAKPARADDGVASDASDLFEDALREGDDQHLRRRLAQYVLDGRREEARLPAPPR